MKVFSDIFIKGAGGDGGHGERLFKLSIWRQVQCSTSNKTILKPKLDVHFNQNQSINCFLKVLKESPELSQFRPLLYNNRWRLLLPGWSRTSLAQFGPAFHQVTILGEIFCGNSRLHSVLRKASSGCLYDDHFYAHLRKLGCFLKVYKCFSPSKRILTPLVKHQFSMDLQFCKLQSLLEAQSDTQWVSDRLLAQSSDMPPTCDSKLKRDTIVILGKLLRLR